MNETDPGAQLLDQVQPDWWKQIRLKKLDMTSLETCVLGQLYGNYFYGLSALGLISGMKHGFDTMTTDLDALTKAWKNQVLDRKFKQETPDSKG
jgi:hypothetical protein